MTPATSAAAAAPNMPISPRRLAPALPVGVASVLAVVSEAESEPELVAAADVDSAAALPDAEALAPPVAAGPKVPPPVALGASLIEASAAAFL
jgi:hypothetical protein